MIVLDDVNQFGGVQWLLGNDVAHQLRCWTAAKVVKVRWQINCASQQFFHALFAPIGQLFQYAAFVLQFAEFLFCEQSKMVKDNERQ